MAVSKKAEREKTKTGFTAVLYKLSLRAYLAILMDKIDLDNFIEKASESSILSVIETIINAHL